MRAITELWDWVWIYIRYNIKEAFGWKTGGIK
jgi:hypothetical protein